MLTREELVTQISEAIEKYQQDANALNQNDPAVQIYAKVIDAFKAQQKLLEAQESR